MATSETALTLNGLFKAVYQMKICDLIPDSTMLVHPDTYNKLMEDSMGTLDCEAKCVEQTPMQRALESHKYQIKQLRESIARKQMELKIELARYTAVKKLAAKGVK